MTLDPFAPPPPPMRRLGRSSALVHPPRRHQSNRTSSELSVRYTPGELRGAFRSAQSPVATTVAAVSFGLGLAMLLIGLSSLSFDAWLLVGGGLMLFVAGACVLAIPALQAREALRDQGIDGVVSLRLLVNQNGLVVIGRDEANVTPWSAIDRVQMHDGHVGLIAGRRFIVPPLRLDDEQGPFAARVLAHANGTDSVAPVRTTPGGLAVPSDADSGSSYAIQLAVALFLVVATLVVVVVMSDSNDLLSCPDGQLAYVTQPGGPNTPIVVDCIP